MKNIRVHLKTRLSENFKFCLHFLSIEVQVHTKLLVKKFILFSIVSIFFRKTLHTYSFHAICPCICINRNRL
jgi:hypothetical protein